jgi:hypothetical protein
LSSRTSFLPDTVADRAGLDIRESLMLHAALTDESHMGRSVTGLCVLAGMTGGGFVPELWGASGFSFASVVFTAIGGIAGIWLGVRLSDA